MAVEPDSKYLATTHFYVRTSLFLSQLVQQGKDQSVGSSGRQNHVSDLLIIEGSQAGRGKQVSRQTGRFRFRYSTGSGSGSGSGSCLKAKT